LIAGSLLAHGQRGMGEVLTISSSPGRGIWKRSLKSFEENQSFSVLTSDNPNREIFSGFALPARNVQRLWAIGNGSFLCHFIITKMERTDLSRSDHFGKCLITKI
jgi:hypothetical protein